jgi:hypothetical protein
MLSLVIPVYQNEASLDRPLVALSRNFGSFCAIAAMPVASGCILNKSWKSKMDVPACPK